MAEKHTMPLLILLVFEDAYDRDLLVEELKSSAQEQNARIETYYRHDTDIYTVLDSALNRALFAEHKLIVLKYSGGFMPADAGVLLDYLNRASPVTTLVITVDSLKQKAGTSSDSMKELLKSLERASGSDLLKIQSRGVLVDMTGKKKGKGEPLEAWIQTIVSKRGMKIARDAAQLLIEMSGKDKYTIVREIDKLTGVKGEGARITIDDVSTIAAENRVFDIYALIDAVCEGKSAHAINTLRNLLASDIRHPYILWHLDLFYSKAILAHYLIRSGENSEEAARKAGQRFYVKKFLNNIKTYSYERLLEIPSQLLEAERMIKTGLPERTVMEQLILDLI